MAFESGLRAALKAEIASHAAVADRVEAARGAVERVEDQLHAARRKLREAADAAGEEQERLVQEIVAGSSATLLERVNGRAREADAEREIDLCKAARDLCKVALANEERSLGWAERKVKSAVGAVLAGAVDGLFAEAQDFALELDGKRAVLAVLRPMLPDELSRKIYLALPDLVLGDPGHPAVLAWQAAADALSRDPDAFLPPDKDGAS